MAVPAQHLVCGRVFTWGKSCILCVRAETAGRLTQEAYFKSEDWSDPTLREEPDKFSFVMPSGFVLLEVSKKPTNPLSQRRSSARAAD